MSATYTPYHSQYLAHRITLDGSNDDVMAKTAATAKVHVNPHQVDAALFALQSPLSKGALFADEVGLGKTIEAGLVIAEKWAEGKRRILLTMPATLRTQWIQELWEKFHIECQLLDTHSYKEFKKAGRDPFDHDAVVVMSYEFAAAKAEEIAKTAWHLAIFDEAHRLRSVYKKKGGSRAKQIRNGFRNVYKLLLTATPLQNSIMELYGLVSIIDGDLFGDEASFRRMYDADDPADLRALRARLAPICQRSLRRDVQEAGHIQYTERIPITVNFKPHPEEFTLYQKMSAYLQRTDKIYLNGQNPLVTALLRKILGSSSFAISKTLLKIIERLEKMQRPATDAEIETIEGLFDDYETAKDMVEESSSSGEIEVEPYVDPKKLAAELSDLHEYHDLAVAIQSNAKGEQLVAELPKLLDGVVAKGGSRKVVIFTESVRTQTYLADLLATNGFDRSEIIRLNGSNTDTESQAIYKDWLVRTKAPAADNKITQSTQRLRSKTADMKQAVIEAFRDTGTILIATESGAEGINLQFCSLIVNYDLPWNPQRVEQRIGRCHRWGQKNDVTVVNFLNTENEAEKRILELLTEKFQLFSGVFGASDEVLGAVISGGQFEKQVHQIIQTSRSTEEIGIAFDRLTASLQTQISGEIKVARERLLLNMDEDVVRRLRTRQNDMALTISEFEHRLVILARAELPGCRFWIDDATNSPCFEYEGFIWTTNWALADERKWRFFRLTDDNPAMSMASDAKARSLPVRHLIFDYTTHKHCGGSRFTDLEEFIGASGWLKISKLTVQPAGRKIDYVLSTVVLDDGRNMERRHIDRLFMLPAIVADISSSIPSGLTVQDQVTLEQQVGEIKNQNKNWLGKESDKLDRYAGDLEVAAEEEIKRLTRDVRDRRRALKLSHQLAREKITEQRAIKRLEFLLDTKKAGTFRRRREVKARVDGMLEKVRGDLEFAPIVEPVMTIRWSLIA